MFAKAYVRGILMIEPMISAQGLGRPKPLKPNRISCEGAATPIIVHGHRLSSLYRGSNTRQYPFIVLKILKKWSETLIFGYEYLENNEDKARAA